MSHFYGIVDGGRGTATRCGHKTNGLTTIAKSWRGQVTAYLYHDETTGQDHYRVYIQGKHGEQIGDVIEGQFTEEN